LLRKNSQADLTFQAPPIRPVPKKAGEGLQATRAPTFSVIVAGSEESEMTKPTKSSAELVELIRAEMKDFASCPPTMKVLIQREGVTSWRVLTNSESMHGYADCVAAIGQISARLRSQYDLKD
jgi:hypothetical protein